MLNLEEWSKESVEEIQSCDMYIVAHQPLIYHKISDYEEVIV